jgi:hypothetical protein
MQKPRKQSPRERLLKRGGLAAALIAVFAGGAFTIARVMHSGSAEAPKKLVETIHLQLVPPPPLPPPPPQPIVKPPEQQKFMEQPKLASKPVDKPPDAPKAAALSTDIKGPGGDSFGLSGSSGGNTIGGGGQDTGKFGWYASIIQTEIQSLLQKDDKLRAGRYRVTLSIWLSPSGKPDRVKLLNATGDGNVDKEIEEQLAAMPALREAPPHDMPQPVNLRIEGRPSG